MPRPSATGPFLLGIHARAARTHQIRRYVVAFGAEQANSAIRFLLLITLHFWILLDYSFNI